MAAAEWARTSSRGGVDPELEEDGLGAGRRSGGAASAIIWS